MLPILSLQLSTSVRKAHMTVKFSVSILRLPSPVTAALDLTWLPMDKTASVSHLHSLPFTL